jgi:hypothetical protein
VKPENMIDARRPDWLFPVEGRFFDVLTRLCMWFFGLSGLVMLIATHWGNAGHSIFLSWVIASLRWYARWHTANAAEMRRVIDAMLEDLQ